MTDMLEKNEPERPTRSTLQMRICNTLTLIGLVTVIIWGGYTIFSSGDNAAPTEPPLPGDPETVIGDTLDMVTEDEVRDTPAPIPVTVPADTVCETDTAVSDTMVVHAHRDSLSMPHPEKEKEHPATGDTVTTK